MRHHKPRFLFSEEAADPEILISLTKELSFNHYLESFPCARALGKRKVSILSGPPNSGKSFTAFSRLSKAASGAYLSPLRLLALEGRDTLEKMGVKCSLHTGEDFEEVEGARIVCSTIEMLDHDNPVDLIVIDEAQMLYDPYRGWAWTQAILAAPARELIIISAPHAVPTVVALLEVTKESECKVEYFERKGSMVVLEEPVKVVDLQPGDAIVSFSRMDVLVTRDNIMKATKNPVAVVYGSLPSEVRRREAERFASGEAHFLSATDAIGQGLNLPIKRVLFTTLHKFNGIEVVPLPTSEVHQIAGRAGRFSHAEVGYVGVLEGIPGALAALKISLARTIETPADFKPTIGLSSWHVKTISQRLKLGALKDVIDVWSTQLPDLARGSPFQFSMALVDRLKDAATDLDARAYRLSIGDRFIYALAPVPLRDKGVVDWFNEWVYLHATSGSVGKPPFLEHSCHENSPLNLLERAMAGAVLWLYLSSKFPGHYGWVAETEGERDFLAECICSQLRGEKKLGKKSGSGGGGWVKHL